MYTFSAIRRNSKWLIVAIPWDGGSDNEFIINFRHFSKNIGIPHNVLKTELVRHWNGFVGDNNNIEFDSQEDAVNAIENYIDGLQTAAILSKQNQVDDENEEADGF